MLHSDRYLRTRGIRRLSTYSVNEIQSRLKPYFKFVVVRHPMERLVSAFRDKFERSEGVDAYFAACARKIREQGKDSNLSFLNFIEYISSIHRYYYASKKIKMVQDISNLTGHSTQHYVTHVTLTMIIL